MQISIACCVRPKFILLKIASLMLSPWPLTVHQDEKDGTKKTLRAEDLVAQTSLILLAGQDTTVG